MGSTYLTFLGGAGTVTGSKTLLETEQARILIDCGLFQGLKELRLRNWAPLPLTPAEIDAVVLTHAHIDHSGYVPLLAKNGFSGPVHATRATRDLCGILLPDSGYLHEQDAAYANRKGYSKHSPALPLYTEADARACLEQFNPREMNERSDIAPDTTLTFRSAGHILGAASAHIDIDGVRIVFSGDLGRWDDPVMLDPAPGGTADVLVVESTYGGRQHTPASPEDVLADVINKTSARGGTVVIPSFAVGRAQLLMYYLRRLKDEQKIPDLPIFLDSPMAINASELFRIHHDWHHLSAHDARRTCAVAQYVHTADESRALNENAMPKIIISASGMATGGRVLHHLKHTVGDTRNTILFAGYQAPGTRGEAMLNGAETIKIHGKQYPVRAETLNLDMLSAHADEDEILRWLKTFNAPPRLTLVNHGETESSTALSERIRNELDWTCHIPEHMERVAVDG